MKDEILIITKYIKTLVYLLKDIADKLQDFGVNSRLDRKNTTLETEKFIIIGKTPYATCIGRSWLRLKYYTVYQYRDALLKSEEVELFTYRFPMCTKELRSIDDIIRIVRC